MTKAGDMVECPACRVTFRATKRQRKYCCEWCAKDAKRKRDMELKKQRTK